MFERLGYELQDEEALVTELFDGCANYGNVESLKELAGTGIVFYSGHGPGGTYGSYVQASDGELFIDVPGDTDGYPVVRVLENGNVNKDALAEARKYLLIYKRARQALGEAI